jgi:O-antigen/teichoic acid export membrane protein
LLGLIAGHVLAFSLFGLAAWKGVLPAWPAASQLREQLRYGLPLTVTFALAWVVSGSDRLLLAWLLDEEAAGYYSAGYDLAFQSLTLVVTIINTAAFPLAVDALERGGPVQAREQLAHNGELIITTALSGAAGLVILAPAVLGLFIGEAFRPGAAAILPIIAAASAIAAIKAYHFDIAFHLGKHIRTLVWISAMAAVINVGLNLWLIPRLGIVGAAWATLVAYAIALFASAGIGRRAFCMPSALPMLGKSCAAAMFAALGLSLPGLLTGEGPWVLPVAFLGGGLSIIGAAYWLDLAGARGALKGLARMTTNHAKSRSG